MERTVTIKISDSGPEVVHKKSKERAKVHPVNKLPDLLKNALISDLSDEELKLFNYLCESKEFSNKFADNDIIFSYLFNSCQRLILESQNAADSDSENNEIKLLKYFLGPPFNTVISLSIDKEVLKSWTKFDPSNFIKLSPSRWAIKDTEPNSTVKNEEHGLALDYRFVVSGPRDKVSDITRFFENTQNHVKEAIKVMSINSPNSRSTDAWQYFDHFLLFEVQIASLDRIGLKKPKSQRLSKNNLLREKSSAKERNHLVYIARDENKEVKYIGEGQAGREQHVNSGTSHVYELNKKHFSGIAMDVTIYADGLTKSESLAIEFLLLKRYAKLGLWNVKNYEAK